MSGLDLLRRARDLGRVGDCEIDEEGCRAEGAAPDFVNEDWCLPCLVRFALEDT